MKVVICITLGLYLLKSFGLMKKGNDKGDSGEVLYGFLAMIMSILSIVFLWTM